MTMGFEQKNGELLNKMKTILFMFIFMLMAHIIDDYYLQDTLAKLKQKSFWEENAPERLYKHDYIMALILHGFSWSFMIMLPLLIYSNFTLHNIYFIFWLVNGLFHSWIDDCKANKKRINLIEDQIFHMIQILLTDVLYLNYLETGII